MRLFWIFARSNGKSNLIYAIILKCVYFCSLIFFFNSYPQYYRNSHKKEVKKQNIRNYKILCRDQTFLITSSFPSFFLVVCFSFFLALYYCSLHPYFLCCRKFLSSVNVQICRCEYSLPLIREGDKNISVHK